MLRIAFVGAFEPITDPSNAATSAAGNLVQCEILEALKNRTHYSDTDVSAVSHRPLRAWPYGPCYSRASRIDSVDLPGFVNLPVLKHVIFGVSLFFWLLKNKPNLVIAYNPGPFETLAFLVCRLLSSNLFAASIIQDIHTGAGKLKSIRALSDCFSMALARRLDLVIPISPFIIEDFSLRKDRAIVFRGGMTRQSRELLSAEPEDLEPYAVFAGALEPYNGLDILLSKWTKVEGDLVLHVFGKGSLSSLASEWSQRTARIVYHGFAHEDIITRWQAKAAVNFCFRYSKGINQRYFFPSKFFNVLAAPGAVVANRFDGFPADVADYCYLVNDDLSNLPEIIQTALSRKDSTEDLAARRKWLEVNAEWGSLLQRILDVYHEHDSVESP